MRGMQHVMLRIARWFVRAGWGLVSPPNRPTQNTQAQTDLGALFEPKRCQLATVWLRRGPIAAGSCNAAAHGHQHRPCHHRSAPLHLYRVVDEYGSGCTDVPCTPAPLRRGSLWHPEQ